MPMLSVKKRKTIETKNCQILPFSWHFISNECFWWIQEIEFVEFLSSFHQQVRTRICLKWNLSPKFPLRIVSFMPIHLFHSLQKRSPKILLRKHFSLFFVYKKGTCGSTWEQILEWFFLWEQILEWFFLSNFEKSEPEIKLQFQQ